MKLKQFLSILIDTLKKKKVVFCTISNFYHEYNRNSIVACVQLRHIKKYNEPQQENCTAFYTQKQH